MNIIEEKWDSVVDTLSNRIRIFPNFHQHLDQTTSSTKI